MKPHPISACLIVRDEEASLPRCLASLSGIVSQIVVVDTGSRDASAAIARSHGALVSSFPWGEDFSAARNAALDLATQPWILSIDADEELLTDSVAALDAALASPEAGLLVRMRLMDGQGGHVEVPLPRLFRNDPRIRWSRAIHESVTDALWELGTTTPPQTAVTMVHHGYGHDAVLSRGKLERNLRIHRRTREAGKADAFDLFKQAQILLSPAEAAERREVLEDAWRLHEAAPAARRKQWPWGGKLRALFGQVLCQAGELGRAGQVLALDPEDTAAAELPLARLEWAWRTGNWSTADEDSRHAAAMGEAPAGLEARTRRARCESDRSTLGTIAASTSIEASCWLALLDLEEGFGEQGMGHLARPMAMAPQEHIVRLASGIFLASYGDPASASSLFAGIDGFCQPLARAWEIALRRHAGESALLLLSELERPTHHEEVALALELARRSQAPFAPDTAFDPNLLERRRLAWSRVLDAR